MDTSLEHVHEEHVHELEPHIKVARARAGVMLLILSDALAILAILAGGGYLRALNSEGQYKIAGDFAPAFVPGLLIAIALVLSGFLYYLVTSAWNQPPPLIQRPEKKGKRFSSCWPW